MAMPGRVGEGVVSKIALIALAAACLSAAVTCSSEQPAQRNTGAGGQTTAVSGTGGSGIGGGMLVVNDAAVTPPSSVVFPDPPFISCDDSAADGGGCDFAPSVCNLHACDDAGACTPTQWIKAYANPRCVAGQCVWDPAYYNCQDLCVDGRCFYNGTTLP